MTERKVAIPRFEVLRRGRLIKRIPIHRNRVVIGSEEGADIRLKHPAIAPRHLEVVVVNGRYLEASNLAGEGRVLLGQRPMNRARLREGDELDLGPVTLRLTYTHTDSRASLRAVEGPKPRLDPDGEATDPLGSPRPSDPGVPRASPAPPVAETASLAPGAPLRAEPTPPPGLPFARTTGPQRAGLGRPIVGGARSKDSADLAGGVDVDLEEGILDPVPTAVIEPPGGRPQRVPLRIGSFVVGAGRCAFRLSYPGVAPAHLELMVMPDGAVYIKHLAGGGQRTLLNGAPVQFSRWSPGDRLQVGPVSIRLEEIPRTSAAPDERATIEEEVPLPDDSFRAPLEEPTEPLEVPLEAASTLRGLKFVPHKPDRDDSGIGQDPFSPFPASHPPRPPLPPTPAPASTAPSPVPPAPTRPAPPVLAAASVPLVVARGARPDKTKPPRLTTPSPLVTTNTVQVSLRISAEDTYAQLYTDDMLAYQPARWKRVTPVLAFLLLLGVVGLLGLRLYGPDVPAPTAPGAGPVTASGVSGLDGDGADVTDGSERLVVGARSPGKKRKAVRARAGSSSPDDSEGVDWDEDRARRLARGPVGSYYDDLANAPVQEAVAEGRFDSDEVERLLYSHQKRFKACYEKLREVDAGAEGVVWLSLTLDTGGRIREVVTEPRSTLKSDELSACLARRISPISLPPARGADVTFSYKLEFRN
jgi:pSer/pThr/pTyr-binding forkhead associated (FHA) protein